MDDKKSNYSRRSERQYNFEEEDNYKLGKSPTEHL